LYLRSAELQDQLRQTRLECTAAEEASLDADRRALESRFEMEEMRATLVEQESRLGELEDELIDAREKLATRRAATGGSRQDSRARLFKSGRATSTTTNHGRKPLQLSPLANNRGGNEKRTRRPRSGGSTRRERELEQTVEKLRMVLETKQNSLKQKETVSTRMSDALRQNRRLKAKLEEAESIVARGEGAIESKTKLVKECDGLRKELNDAEQNVQKVRMRAKKFAKANSHLKTRLSEMEIEMDTLRQRALRTVSPVRDTTTHISSSSPTRQPPNLAVLDLEAEVQQLQKRNKELVLAQQRVDARVASRDADGIRPGADSDIGLLQDALLSAQREKSTLEDENAALKEELSALTPEFFEEIENLKFRFQEAVEENDRLRDRVRRL
jgi:centrosomal protein CEP290